MPKIPEAMFPEAVHDDIRKNGSPFRLDHVNKNNNKNNNNKNNNDILQECMDFPHPYRVSRSAWAPMCVRTHTEFTGVHDISHSLQLFFPGVHDFRTPFLLHRKTTTTTSIRTPPKPHV